MSDAVLPAFPVAGGATEECDHEERQDQPPADTPLRNAQTAIEQRFGPVEYRSSDELRAYAGNPRQHSDHKLVQLTASINEFGFVMPVLIDAEGEIIAGEARVLAARRLKMREVPVLVADHWSQAQVKAYRLADNRLAEQSSWSLDLLRTELAAIVEMGEVSVEVLGWHTAEIDVILDGGGNEDATDPADELSEPPAHPVTVAGDLWLPGKHRLLCASSLDPDRWTQLLGGRTAAMAFTDGPYNVPVQGHVSGLGKARHANFAMASGEMSVSDFTKFNGAYLTNLATCSRDGAIIMACMDLRHLPETLGGAAEAGLSLINLCVWRKSNAGMGSLYRSQHELVLILKKGSGRHVNNVELGRHGRYRTNVWTMLAPTRSAPPATRTWPTTRPSSRPHSSLTQSVT